MSNQRKQSPDKLFWGEIGPRCSRVTRWTGHHQSSSISPSRGHKLGDVVLYKRGSAMQAGATKPADTRTRSAQAE